MADSEACEKIIEQPCIRCNMRLLAAWSVDRPRHWPRRVNRPQSEDELKALRR